MGAGQRVADAVLGVVVAAAALVGAGTALSLWPLSLAVSTTDQTRSGFSDAAALVIIMDRLPSNKVLGTFRDLKTDGMTETSRMGRVTDDGGLGFTV